MATQDVFLLTQSLIAHFEHDTYWGVEDENRTAGLLLVTGLEGEQLVVTIKESIGGSGDPLDVSNLGLPLSDRVRSAGRDFVADSALFADTGRPSGVPDNFGRHPVSDDPRTPEYHEGS